MVILFALYSKVYGMRTVIPIDIKSIFQNLSYMEDKDGVIARLKKTTYIL